MYFIGVRHGQSVFNVKGLCNDDPHTYVPLTTQGVHQARKAAFALQNESIEKIFVSPLLRARQTAEIINEELDLPLHVENRLADIRSGFDGKPVADYFAAIESDPLHTRVNNGESILDYHQRVSAFLNELQEKAENHFMLVAHEETLRVFKAWSEGLPVEKVIGLPFDNAYPYRFERFEKIVS